MLAKDIDAYVRAVKQRLGIRKYMPAKYFLGLKTKKAIRARMDDIMRGGTQFQTDSIPVPRKQSTYSRDYAKVFNGKKNATGIPPNVLKTVYNRGLAAWKSGHRVGATPQQWGSARQKSFALRGCTWYSADHDLAVRAMKKMNAKNVRAWTSRDACARHAHDCCTANSNKKWCTDKTTGKVFKLPRKFSKAACTKGPVRGFTMRASCTPYRGCSRIYYI
jgi:hypothetical protein